MQIDALKISRRRLLGGAATASWALSRAPSRLIGADKPPSKSQKDVSWLAEVQTPPSKSAIEQPDLSAVLVDGEGRAIRTLAAWKKRREEVRAWWRDFLGELPIDRSRPPTLEVLARETLPAVGGAPGVLRQRVRYFVEPDEPTEAYLLRPVGHVGPMPGVVVMHSTVNHSIRQPSGVEGRPEKAFGLQLARRGIAAFCPRNFLWPTNHRIDTKSQTARHQRRHPGVSGMAKMLLNDQRALDILAAQKDVDPARLGAVGHSLGAKEALYLAAFDERVRATVSSEGGIGVSFSNWNAPWYMGPRIKQPDFGHDHHELLALAAPRPFLLIGGESADGDRSWPYIEAALPAYRLYGRPARLGLFNHRAGHAVPPEAERRIYDWLQTYL